MSDEHEIAKLRALNLPDIYEHNDGRPWTQQVVDAVIAYREENVLPLYAAQLDAATAARSDVADAIKLAEEAQSRERATVAKAFKERDAAKDAATALRAQLIATEKKLEDVRNIALNLEPMALTDNKRLRAENLLDFGEDFSEKG